MKGWTTQWHVQTVQPRNKMISRSVDNANHLECKCNARATCLFPTISQLFSQGIFRPLGLTSIDHMVYHICQPQIHCLECTMAVPVSIATEERGNFKIHVSHLVLQTFGMRFFEFSILRIRNRSNSNRVSHVWSPSSVPWRRSRTGAMSPATIVLLCGIFLQVPGVSLRFARMADALPRGQEYHQALSICLTPTKIR